MKTNLSQRLIQLAAVIVLVWLAVHDVRHSGVASLIPFGIVGIIFFAQWLITNNFPKTTARRRVFGKLVWVLISFSLLFTALSFINFDISTSHAFSLTLNFTFILLVLTYMQREELSRQLVEKEKADALAK